MGDHIDIRSFLDILIFIMKIALVFLAVLALAAAKERMSFDDILEMSPQDQDLLQKIASNEMFMNLLSDPRVEAVLEKLSAKYQEITNPAEDRTLLLGLLALRAVISAAGLG